MWTVLYTFLCACGIVYNDDQVKIHSLFIGFLFAVLFPFGVVYASGVHSEAPDALHPVTQIGLPDSVLKHGEKITATSGLTREEVGALVEETINEEARRSIVKFILLSIGIFGLIALFYAPSRHDSGGDKTDAGGSQAPSIGGSTSPGS